MILRRIPAHDGLELVSYLTRAVTEGSSPLVLLVHGGEKFCYTIFLAPWLLVDRVLSLTKNKPPDARLFDALFGVSDGEIQAGEFLVLN